jgi:tRNA A37 N6-isopentenylltransferase MiaA
MFSWKKHKLPKFPDGAAEVFKSLCASIEEDQATALRVLLQETYEEMKANSHNNPRMNVARLEEVYSTASYLMNHYSSFSPHEQTLIVGAVRYFAIDQDVANDLAFFTGLDDDAKILNYVLEQIGVNDRYIKLQGSIWK